MTFVYLQRQDTERIRTEFCVVNLISILVRLRHNPLDNLATFLDVFSVQSTFSMFFFY